LFNTKLFQTTSIGTVHTPAKARLTSVAIQMHDRHQNLIMFIGPLPTFAENFMHICSEVFAQSC